MRPFSSSHQASAKHTAKLMAELDRAHAANASATQVHKAELEQARQRTEREVQARLSMTQVKDARTLAPLASQNSLPPGGDWTRLNSKRRVRGFRHARYPARPQPFSMFDIAQTRAVCFLCLCWL